MPYLWPTFGPLVRRIWAGMSSIQQGSGREDAGSRSSSSLWGVRFDGDYYGSGSGIQTTSDGVCTSSDAWLREGCMARRWLPSIYNTDNAKFVFTCCLVQGISSAITGPQLILDLKKKSEWPTMWSQQTTTSTNPEPGQSYSHICIIYYALSIHNIHKTRCNNYNWVILFCLGVFTFCTCGIVTCLGWFVASFKLSCV